MSQQSRNNGYQVASPMIAAAITSMMSATIPLFIIAMLNVSSEWKWLLISGYLLFIPVTVIILVKIIFKKRELILSAQGVEVDKREYSARDITKIVLHKQTKQVRIYLQGKWGYHPYVILDAQMFAKVVEAVTEWAKSHNLTLEII